MSIAEKAIWIKDSEIFYVPKYFEEAALSNDNEMLIMMVGICKSKFPQYTVLSYEDNLGNNLVSVAALDDTTITFPELDKVVALSRRDIIIFFGNIDFKLVGEYQTKRFKFQEKSQIIGEGPNMFEVVATIRDEYRLKVRASSEYEAIEKANEVELSEWEHPDIEPHLLDRKITRHARWGNLTAKEII
jgi:hypothetical protein